MAHVFTLPSQAGAGGTGNVREAWLSTPIRPRSRTGRIAALRPTVKTCLAYPELCCLAHAVLAQAGKDAEPERHRGGKPKVYSNDVRERQFQALTWLCSSDPDLVYWLHLADYSLHSLHHKYEPLLTKLTNQFPSIAYRMNVPGARLPPPRFSTSRNGVPSAPEPSPMGSAGGVPWNPR